MNICSNEQKTELLETIEALGRMIPVMDMDDRNFTAAVLYRMAQIVREHGPSHGINLNYDPRLERLKEKAKIYLNDYYGHKDIETDIDKVIFNPPATVIYWKDGTKTVVKCSDDDLDAGRLSPETGIVYAIVKKVLGNKGKYNNVLKRLVNRAVKN